MSNRRHSPRVLSQWTRAGRVVKEVELTAEGMCSRSYLVDHPERRKRPALVVAHGHRDDRATHLEEVFRFVDRGFVAVSADLSSIRGLHLADHSAAVLERSSSVVSAAIQYLASRPDVIDHGIALVGWGVGAEVATRAVVTTGQVRAAVIVDALVRRSSFIADAAHPVAAGVHRRLGRGEAIGLARSVKPFDLLDQLVGAPTTNWLVQLAGDDDRISVQDTSQLRLGLPLNASLDLFEKREDLRGYQAAKSRGAFIARFI